MDLIFLPGSTLNQVGPVLFAEEFFFKKISGLSFSPLAKDGPPSFI
jgi:hypothetical protein